MSDALRFDRPTPSGDLPEHDRDARVEDLLLAGLDHYFVGQYELAINVWTRVLFVDRGHARARAYIERARGAIAERQREAEELLHSGAAAFNRGDVDAARRLLTTAVERGAGNEEALALLDRLDRLGAPAGNYEPSVLPPLRPRGDRHHVAVPSANEERSRIAWVAAGIITGLLLAASGVAFLFARGEWSALDRDVAVGATQGAAREPLPVPGGGDIWLARARALHAKGRLHEALAALDAIRQEDVRSADADELRAAIQRALLAAGRATLANRPAPVAPAPPPAGLPVRR
jgi:tetratricopeptide (TPR) repeat protein